MDIMQATLMRCLVKICIALAVFGSAEVAARPNDRCGKRICTVNGIQHFCAEVQMDCCEGPNGNIMISADRKSRQKCCFDAPKPVYDKITELCDGATVVPITGDLQQCGPNKVYRSLSQVCISEGRNFYIRDKPEPAFPEPVLHDSVESPQHEVTQIELGRFSCSGGEPPPKGYLCNIHDGWSVAKQSPEDDEICGGTTYNSKNQICGPANIVINIPNGQKSCGQHLSNPERDQCCDGHYVPNGKIDGIKCCGNQQYNPSVLKCCDDGLHPKNWNEYKCKDEKDFKQVYAYIFFVKRSRCELRMGSRQCAYKGSVMNPAEKSKFGSQIPTLLYNKVKVTWINNNATALETGWYLIGTDKPMERNLKLRGEIDWFSHERIPDSMQKSHKKYLRQQKREKKEKKRLAQLIKNV